MVCVSTNKDIKDLYRLGERYDVKNEKKKDKKKKDKNDKIPRARDWTLTTDRNMVRSDALPTELRGTCLLCDWTLKSCFRCLSHYKNQA